MPARHLPGQGVLDSTPACNWAGLATPEARLINPPSAICTSAKPVVAGGGVTTSVWRVPETL